MTRTLKGIFVASACALSLAVGAPAAAQQQQEEVSPYVQQVIDQLAAISPQLAQNGYGAPEVVGFNAINGGATETLNYTTQDSTDIVFVGVCDNDCSDLDLRVRNAQGGLVGEDVLADAVPVVQAAQGARPLSVDVIMTTCSQNPCVYGVAVYRKNK